MLEITTSFHPVRPCRSRLYALKLTAVSLSKPNRFLELVNERMRFLCTLATS
jgi:hypothetical protein